MFLLTRLGVDTSRVTSGLYYVVLGLGMGFLMQMGLADRAEQRRAAGHGRGQQRPDVLPADRRLARVSAFGAIFASRLTASLRGSGWFRGSHQRQRRPARSDRGQQAARADQARRVLRHRARGPGACSSGRRRPRCSSSSWRCCSRKSRCAAGRRPRAAKPQPQPEARVVRPGTSPPGKPNGPWPTRPRSFA